MSLQNALTTTKNNLRRIRKAILGRGGEISDTAGLKHLKDAITDIPADASLAYYTDEEIAYRKTVPSGVKEYALVKSIGGMSYKTVNLINDTNAYPKTVAGVTIDFKDGVYTFNGTATSTAGLTFQTGLYLPSGTYCLMSNTAEVPIDTAHYILRIINADVSQHHYLSHNVVNASKIFTITADTFNVQGQIREGTVFNNFTMKPMLALSDVVVPFSPHFEGLRHSKVTELVSDGANFAKTTNGTYTLNNYYSATLNNGHVRIDRKASSSAKECSSLLMSPYTEVYLPAGTYTMKCHNVVQENISCAFYVFDSAGGVITSGGTLAVSRSFTLSAPATIKWGIYSTAKTEYVEIDGYMECDVMLNTGNTAETLKPYVGILGTLEIPEEVQALDGWGLGINAEYNNHIEWRDGRAFYVQEVVETVIDENIIANPYTANQYPEGVYCYYYTKAKRNGKVGYQTSLCSHFNNVNGIWGASTGSIGDYSDHTSYAWIYVKTDKPTVADFEAYLKEQKDRGNPVTLVYALAEPIETDITEYFTRDNFLKVEGGGTITAVNEYENAVPTTIQYITNTGG